ncbi:hypothetical protein FO519_002745 [Halicephalobus sp. NKZ332]|nr:hypothetical protein FO519_002745 [Halicephalobus sp. NKZ332]
MSISLLLTSSTSQPIGSPDILRADPDPTSPDDSVLSQDKRSSVYGMYRYIPKIGRSKIKKDLDYPFANGDYDTFFYTE